jgi:hypothetical protein
LKKPNNLPRLFEFTFRDERYLPFEGAGAVESNWKGQLPSAFRSFGSNTISDVILHIRYTSKEEDGLFRKKVEEEILERLNLIPNLGLLRLISLKHDFPSAFKLLNPSQRGKQETEFGIGKNYFPYFLAKMNLALPLQQYF